MAREQSPGIDQMVAVILRIYRAASPEQWADGMAWYDQARAEAQRMADQYGVSLEVAAAVIAAHSANQQWAPNLVSAEQHLAGAPKGMRRVLEMADAAIAGAGLSALSGPKVVPFGYNLAGDLSRVATDRWAQRAVYIDGAEDIDWAALSKAELKAIDLRCNRLVSRVGQRDALIDAYSKAAAEAGVEPAQMQAVVWVVVRGAAG